MPKQHRATPGPDGGIGDPVRALAPATDAPQWNSAALDEIDDRLASLADGEGNVFAFIAAIAAEVDTALDQGIPPDAHAGLRTLEVDATGVMDGLTGMQTSLADLRAEFPDQATAIGEREARFRAVRNGPEYYAARLAVFQKVPVDSYRGKALPAPVRRDDLDLAKMVDANAVEVRAVLDETEALTDMAAQGAGASGQFAFDVAADIALGPLAAFPIGTAHEAYLWEHLVASQTSQAVVNKAAFLTARPSPYPNAEGAWEASTDAAHDWMRFGYESDVEEEIVGEGSSRVDPFQNPWSFAKEGPKDQPVRGQYLPGLDPTAGWTGFGFGTAPADPYGMGLPAQGPSPTGKGPQQKVDGEHESAGTRVSNGVGNGKIGGEWSGSAHEGQVFTGTGTVQEKRDDHSSTSLAGTATINTEGPNSGGYKYENQTADGKKTQHGASIDTDGKVSGEYGTSVGKGGTLTGSVDFDPWGDDKTIGGSLGYEKNGYSVKTSGSVQTVISKPVKKATGWVVAYEIRRGAKVDGGKSSKDKSVGGKLGFSVDNVQAGTKVFATETEANAFYDTGNPGPVETNLSADDALAMSPGEERSEVTGKGGSVGVTGKMGMVSIGGEGSAKKTTGSKIVRGAGNQVLVEESESEGVAASGNVGVGIAGAYKGIHSGSAKSRTYAFDLGTPEGKLAYTMYTKTGVVPTALGGFKEVARNDSETEGDSWGMSFTPALGFGESSTVTSGTMIKDGQKSEYDIGTQSSKLAIWGLGHLSRSHTLNAWQVDDKESFYSVASKVDASDSDDAAISLQKATGTQDSAVDPSGDADGKWTARSTFSEAQMDTFIAYAKSDSFYWKTDAWFNNHGHDLRKALRNAKGDKDRERNALAVFVSEAGHEALEVIRKVTHGGDDQHLELDGDEWWTGLKGHIEIEGLVQEWTRRLGDPAADKWAVYYEAQEKAVYLREKVAKIPEYRDVPDELLRQELERSRIQLAKVNDVMQAAMSLPTETGDNTAKKAMIADPMLARVADTRRRMVAERVATDEARRPAVRYYDAIEEGYRAQSKGTAGGEIRKVKDKRFTEVIDRAKGDHERAELLYGAARAAEEELDTARLEDDSRKALALALRAASAFTRARQAYEASYKTYHQLSAEFLYYMPDLLRGTTRVKPM